MQLYSVILGVLLVSWLIMVLVTVFTKWENEMIDKEFQDVLKKETADSRCCICKKDLDITQTQRVIRVGTNNFIACIMHQAPEIVRFIKDSSKSESNEKECKDCNFWLGPTYCLKMDGIDGSKICRFWTKRKGA